MSLYDDRTFENLQAEALEDLRNKIEELPENQRVDASEGSLLYLAVAKQAVRLEEAYQDLEALNENMLVDTQDLEHLIDSGAECGVPIREGTAAIVLAELDCPCEIGDEFSAIDSEYNYRAIELVEVISREAEDEDEEPVTIYRYKMEATDEGIEPGSYRGEIEPDDYLKDFEEGRIVSCVTPGTEQEDEDVYRERRLNSFTSKACAGNRDYYLDTIGALAGVGGVKVERRKVTQTVIPCYIQASDYGVPSAELLASIKDIMDPDGYEGEGAGLCPLGHILDLHPVEGIEINVSASFVFDEGYTFPMLKNAMREVIQKYITELAREWQNQSIIVVRRAMVESKILSVKGVLDISDLTLNGGEDNITTTAYQVPIFGTITNSGEPTPEPEPDPEEGVNDG